jgi:hypothetical protein
VKEDQDSKARRAEVTTEPTGVSWIMLLQAKTAFSQDNLGACPLSKTRQVWQPFPPIFSGEEDQGDYKGAELPLLKGIDSFVSYLVREDSLVHHNPNTSRSRVLHREVARTWVTAVSPDVLCASVPSP